MPDENPNKENNPILLALGWPDTVLSDFTRVFCQVFQCEVGLLLLPHPSPQQGQRVVGHFNLEEDLLQQLQGVRLDFAAEVLYRGALTRSGLLWTCDPERMGPFERYLLSLLGLHTLVCGVFDAPGGQKGIVYGGCSTSLAPRNSQKVEALQVLQSISMGLELQEVKRLSELDQKVLGFFVANTRELVAQVKDGRWLTVNPAFEHVLGYTTQELEGQYVVELLVGNEDAVSAFHRVLAGQFAQKVPFRFLSKDGQVKHIEWVGCPDSTGTVMLMGQDVTAEVEKKERIKRFHQQSWERSDRSPLFLWTNDGIGVGYLNRAFLDYLGCRNLFDMDWMNITHSEDISRIMETMQWLIMEQEPWMFRVRLKRFDGMYRHMQTMAMPRFTEEGEYLGHHGIHQDVHEETMLKLGLNPQDSA